MYSSNDLNDLRVYMENNINASDFKQIIDEYVTNSLSAKEIIAYFMQRKANKTSTIEEESNFKQIVRICSGRGKYPSFLNSNFSIPNSKSPQTNGSNSSSTYSATYSSFSGTDMIAYITLPIEISDGEPIPIGELQTISYSIHRETVPVRTLGSINPTGFTAGAATIAGSLIFTVFDENLVYTIQDRIQKHLAKQVDKSQYAQGITNLNGVMEYDSQNITSQYVNMSMMPAFNILLTARNEYTPGNHGSTLLIEGVVIVDEGQIMSIEDMITENTMSFMATNIRPLRSEIKRGR